MDLKKEEIKMDFKTFISRLKEVRDIGRIENGYSHIVCEIMYYSVLNATKYMLVDTSTYKRATDQRAKSNENFLGKDICAVPDFVITNKTDKIDEIIRYGCIEVKFCPKEVDVHLFDEKNKYGKNDRLYNHDDRIGYLEAYKNHVVYTNGWKWNYYDGTEKVPAWTFDFTNEENRNKEYYNNLIKALKEIWTA